MKISLINICVFRNYQYLKLENGKMEMTNLKQKNWRVCNGIRSWNVIYKLKSARNRWREISQVFQGNICLGLYKKNPFTITVHYKLTFLAISYSSSEGIEIYQKFAESLSNNSDWIIYGGDAGGWIKHKYVDMKP